MLVTASAGAQSNTSVMANRGTSDIHDVGRTLCDEAASEIPASLYIPFVTANDLHRRLRGIRKSKDETTRVLVTRVSEEVLENMLNS